VAHQILVRIAQDVIALSAVFGEIKAPCFENRDQIGQALDLLFALAQFNWSLKSGKSDCESCWLAGQRRNNFLLIIADVGFALQRHHVGKAWRLSEP
jgi:hypothetical protein